jgi:hypothetical protein
MAAQILTEIEPFRFLVGISTREGQITAHFTPISLAPLQSYCPVDVVDQMKADLMERDGTPVSARLATAPTKQADTLPTPPAQTDADDDEPISRSQKRR